MHARYDVVAELLRGLGGLEGLKGVCNPIRNPPVRFDSVATLFHCCCEYLALLLYLVLYTLPLSITALQQHHPNMEAELQTAKDQLALVNLSLEADPSNEDFLKLKTELLELIELTQAAIDKTSGGSRDKDRGREGDGSGSGDKGKGKARAAGGPGGAGGSNWQDMGEYKAGMDCMAKYKDGK